MTKKPFTDTHQTLGSLLRLPYERMAVWLYSELRGNGFDDIRPAFSAVLRNIGPGTSRVSELAARAGLTKQSMSYLVEQMEGCGLVEVAPDEEDRRANTVRLTARGEKAVLTGIVLSKSYEERLASLVGERKIAQLRAILEELAVKLGEVEDR